MRLKPYLVLTTTALVLGFAGIVSAEEPAAATPADTNVTKIMKMADPDIESLKKLEWAKVDLKAESLETRTMAVMALNDLLAMHGERARMRVTMLEDYIELKNLGEVLAVDAEVVPEIPGRTLEDGLKIAVAVVKSPESSDVYVRQVKGVKPEMLQRVYQSYYALCEKNWGEVMYRRFRVQELASFLDRHKQLTSFVTWARDEKTRQKAERADAAKARREEQKREDEIARGKRIATFDKRKEEERELIKFRIQNAQEPNYRDNDYNSQYYRW